MKSWYEAGVDLFTQLNEFRNNNSFSPPKMELVVNFLTLESGKFIIKSLLRFN